MNFRNQILSCLILCSMGLMHASSNRPFVLSKYDGGSAEQWIQALGKEVQLSAGVSEDKLLPIRKLLFNDHRKVYVAPEAVYVKHEDDDTSENIRAIILEKIGIREKTASEKVAYERVAIDALRNCDAGPVPGWLEELGREAQLGVGIPENKLVPIRKMVPAFAASSPSGHARGMAFPEAIYINLKDDDTVQKLRAVMFHEATHIKHRDYQCVNACMLGLAVPFWTVKDAVVECIQYIPAEFNMSPFCTLSGQLFGLAATYAGFMIGNRIDTAGDEILLKAANKIGSGLTFGCEERADREGLTATKCEKCVRDTMTFNFETSADVHNKNSTVSRGYLTREAMRAILDLPEIKGKLCKHHA